ncbi:hypothetical protein [Niabella beijingensis]|uniref:hypothetical protein n=1 Tax=Niabella beijingensis TaxID=2872700 RepID=UPI001CBCE750|nr:hypothetical protein [Niabella beijingensis]MBZ4188891.1 hypothetical protein [Niabella beijingensis]
MKQTVYSCFVACVALVFAISGCNKNTKPQPSLLVANDKPNNPANPHDSFGYWHNVILDSIEHQRELERGFSFTGSCNVIRRFYQRKEWPGLGASHFDPIPEIVISAATDITGFINRSYWGDSVKQRLQQLFAILQHSPTDSLGYPGLKTSLLSFEKQVQESKLSEADKGVILKCSSLARFSAYRWIHRPALMKEYDQQALLKNAERIGIEAPSIVLRQKGLFKKVAQWIAITMTDIGGAIADLSVATGAEASDFMSELMNLN